MSPHLPQRSSLPSLPVKREDNEDYLFFLYIRKIITIMIITTTMIIIIIIIIIIGRYKKKIKSAETVM